MQTNPTAAKITYTIDEARAATGLGKTRLYEEMKLGRIKAVKAGKRTLITASSLAEWVNSLPTV